jgi:multidrug resistance efflux pump
MLLHSLLTSVAVVLAPPAEQTTVSTSEAVIESCDVASIQDLLVPASDAGVLISLDVKEGMPVKKGQPIATIDDREALALFKVKDLEYQIAKQAAESDIDIRNAQKAAEVAKADYDKHEYIRNTVKNAVTEIEYLKRKYEWEKAKLVIEKTQEEAKSNRLTADSKKAESDAAKVALERRRLVAPFDGFLVKAYAQVGEWVQIGEPVLQVVRVDRLRVYGNLDGSKWTRTDIDGRKVTVEVILPRGRKVDVPGKIVFVSPVIGVDSQLPVWAEIDTPMEKGQPLVSAGMKARMTIHSNQLAPTAARPAVPAATSRTSSKR